jgi:hypothetical protein
MSAKFEGDFLEGERTSFVQNRELENIKILAVRIARNPSEL